MPQVYKDKIATTERRKIKMSNKTEFYNYKDVSKKLNVSERSARIIMVQHEFPSFKIGQKVFVRIKDFENWFENLAGKEIPLDPNVNKFKT